MEPDIYFYSGRRSATPYVYVDAPVDTHPLVPQMQQEYIDSVEAWRQKYLVYAGAPGWWGTCDGQDYEAVGVADITADGTIYRRGGDVVNYRIE